jgi:hypothetical protein
MFWVRAGHAASCGTIFALQCTQLPSQWDTESQGHGRNCSRQWLLLQIQMSHLRQNKNQSNAHVKRYLFFCYFYFLQNKSNIIFIPFKPFLCLTFHICGAMVLSVIVFVLVDCCFIACVSV